MTKRVANLLSKLLASEDDRTASRAVWAEASAEGLGADLWKAYDEATRRPADMVAFFVVDGFLHAAK